MKRLRAKSLFALTALVILPAVFVRLELCPLASVCAPVSSEQSAAAPCHEQPNAPASKKEAPHASCCHDINPLEMQAAKLSPPVVVDVLAVLHVSDVGGFDSPRPAVESVLFHPSDPPLFRSYQTLLI